MKSALSIRPWRHAALSVPALIVEWFGSVSVSRPAAVIRSNEMCSRSLTTSKPSSFNARRTLAFGASAGNGGTGLNSCFGYEGFQYRVIFDFGFSERLEVKPDR